jgi:hypothetical protein
MDTTTTLIIVNLVLQVIQMIEKFISRINKSSCFGGSIELSPSSPRPLNTQTNEIENKHITIDVVNKQI